MNIAFIHYCFCGGGAERITLNIADYLAKFGDKYKTFLYSNDITDIRLTDEVRSYLTVREISKYRKERKDDVEKYIKEDNIDIIVLVSYKLSGVESIRKETGVKVVFANHGEPFWERYSIVHRRTRTPYKRFLWKTYRGFLYRKLDIAMKMAVKRSLREYKRCDAYTVLCEAYKEQTCRMFHIPAVKSHITAIENPENPVISPNLDKEKIIMFCGRLENTSKRVDRLLRIWKQIQNKIPDWRLVLVGDGPDGDSIRNLASELGLERVTFEGQQKDTAPYYRKASVVCLTSQTEGWPLCLSEAQAHGCIPIAFNCTAGVEAILAPDRECGFLIKPFNEDEYASTLLHIVGLPEDEKLRIRKNAIAKRLQYTPDIIAEKWKTLFDSLVSNK